MRFGLMQAKLAIIKLLMNFKFSPCARTPIPMKFKPSAPFLMPVDGIFLKVERIWWFLCNKNSPNDNFCATTHSSLSLCHRVNLSSKSHATVLFIRQISGIFFKFSTMSQNLIHIYALSINLGDWVQNFSHSPSFALQWFQLYTSSLHY